MSETKEMLGQSVLAYLKERGGTSCLGIAEDLGLKALDVHLTLKELERRGLARRWFPPLWGATFRDED